MEDYNDDGLLDSYEALVWGDRANDGRGVREWELTDGESPAVATVQVLSIRGGRVERDIAIGR